MNKQEVKRINQEIAERMKTLDVVPESKQDTTKSGQSEQQQTVFTKSNYDEVETDNFGNKYYLLNGELNRLDGPAIECTNGIKQWLIKGKLHRLDGPAVEWVNHNQWWIEGKKYSKAEFNARIAELKA